MATLSSKTGVPINAVNPATQSAIRAGTIMSFAGATTPAGWLACDGSVVLQATYPDLFAQIGHTWDGNGNTATGAVNPLTGVAYNNNGAGAAPVMTSVATQFRLPDLRGAFMRGAGAFTDGIGTDTILAGYQGDQLQGHYHAVAENGGGGAANPSGYLTPTNGNAIVVTPATVLLNWGATTIQTDGVNGTPRIGKETRPRNVGLRMIIKAWDESFNTAGIGGLAQANSMGYVAPRKGQVNLTITNAPMSWVTARAVGIYYQDQDGNHRLKFNIAGTCSNVAKVTFAMTFASPTVVVFKNIPGYFQALHGIIDGVAVLAKVYVQPGTSAILWEHASAPTTIYSCSGDLELESKPTWA